MGENVLFTSCCSGAFLVCLKIGLRVGHQDVCVSWLLSNNSLSPLSALVYSCSLCLINVRSNQLYPVLMKTISPYSPVGQEAFFHIRYSGCSSRVNICVSERQNRWHLGFWVSVQCRPGPGLTRSDSIMFTYRPNHCMFHQSFQMGQMIAVKHRETN